jgi:hypothetical protein
MLQHARSESVILYLAGILRKAAANASCLLFALSIKEKHMDLKEYANFANENKACYLATVDGDQPRVRCLGMWFADETGFYFQAQSVKA